MVTNEQLQLALGTRRSWANEELLTMLNSIESDGADFVRENWLTHSSILREGTYTLDQYTTAVKYVSLKQMGHTNQQAYSIALADRYQDLVARGYNDQRISSHVAAYHKGALVQKMLAQSVVPLHLLYQDEQHQAIRRLATLMTDPNVSYKVQSDSANALLNHVKRPESAKVELDITHKQSDGMAELQTMMRQVAERQMAALQDGGDLRQVANAPVKVVEAIEGEFTEVPR